ncbi:MAG TPA: peptide MFS transporter [Flavobacteriales bacterium]|nr:peptide MFS transporter [Flavobacteriales bacterium]HQV39042.1 peptide MFS transporter [Flavobacteriales bacterium]HQW32701.1 peptide MFS transporter [Flavobacteriales bacterium]HQY03345.1 peptide MFS transporter [Flavobacteriales bacterium]HQY80592.1 peptide MFS transporter [Flavobacteriales bacterium]
MQTLQEIRDFKGKYPRQLWYLFGSEMWERFCFYGMRGMLTVFMVSQLGLDDKTANLQYGAIQAFVYAFTFIGGVFADKILGFQKSLFWGALMMIAGGLVIAFSPAGLFYIGTCFFIIGTGFFKPNISTMVGQLYHEDDPRRDAGFSLFYSGINLGALMGGVLMIWVGKYHSWPLAFGLVSIVMTISLINFFVTKKSLGPIGLSPLHPDMPANKRKMYEIAVYIGSLIAIPFILILVTNTHYTDLFMYIIGPATLVYLGWEMRKFNTKENKRLGAAMVFILFSILFWAFFEQAGGSLSIFALNNLDHTLFGFIPMDPNVINNSSNSLFVIIFAPLVGLLWLWLSKRKLEPNSVVKFGIGFLLLAGAFYAFYATIFFADADGITSLDVFTLGYFIITFGELSLSPIGLSLMTKLSPQPIQGLMMGMWFLASAYGQYVAGLLGAGMSTADPDVSNLSKLVAYTGGYQQLAIYALIAGVVLIAISPVVRRLMKGVH